MEDFNDLGLSYYAAVDSKNDILAAELLAKIITNVKEDNRVLNLLSKFKISDHDKEDVLADINAEIWSNSLSRSRRNRWDSKKMTFDCWILSIGDHIARNHSTALKTKKLRKRRYQIWSDKLVDRNLEVIKKRECELKTKVNPKVKVFGGPGKPQKNRSDLLSTTETELNQIELNQLLNDFSFIFPHPFFHEKTNNFMQVSGIPIRNEVAENIGLLIIVHKTRPEFHSFRRFKAIVKSTAEASGEIKTLEIDAPEIIDGTAIEPNSVCSIQIVIEPPVPNSQIVNFFHELIKNDQAVEKGG